MTNDRLPDRPATPDPRDLRASDADRDRVAQTLREAAGDGRLNLEELDERLTAVYSARTYAELEPITHDLPVTGAQHAVPLAAPDQRVGGTPTWRYGFGILSGFRRRGRWTVPKAFTAISFWGGGTIDLREARYEAAEVRIRAFAVMGGVEVIVPHDIEVVVKGIGIMGGFDDSASGPGAPGAPRVVISGFAFWGGVGVRRKSRKADRADKGAKAAKELED